LGGTKQKRGGVGRFLVYEDIRERGITSASLGGTIWFSSCSLERRGEAVTI